MNPHTMTPTIITATEAKSIIHRAILAAGADPTDVHTYMPVSCHDPEHILDTVMVGYKSKTSPFVIVWNTTDAAALPTLHIPAMGYTPLGYAVPGCTLSETDTMIARLTSMRNILGQMIRIIETDRNPTWPNPNDIIHPSNPNATI